jgi:hypothetical protein
MNALAGMPTASATPGELTEVDTRTEQQRLLAQGRIQGSDPIGQ